MKDVEQPTNKKDAIKPKSAAIPIPQQRERSLSASSTGSSFRSMTDSYTGSPIVQGKRLWEMSDASLSEKDVSTSFVSCMFAIQQLSCLIITLLASTMTGKAGSALVDWRIVKTSNHTFFWIFTCIYFPLLHLTCYLRLWALARWFATRLEILGLMFAHTRTTGPTRL